MFSAAILFLRKLWTSLKLITLMLEAMCTMMILGFFRIEELAYYRRLYVRTVPVP